MFPKHLQFGYDARKCVNICIYVQSVNYLSQKCIDILEQFDLWCVCLRELASKLNTFILAHPLYIPTDYAKVINYTF